MLTQKVKAKQKQKKNNDHVDSTLLSINGCLLVLGVSIASLASGQPYGKMGGLGRSVWVMGEWSVSQWIPGVMRFQKILGLYGEECHKVEKW